MPRQLSIAALTIASIMLSGCGQRNSEAVQNAPAIAPFPEADRPGLKHYTQADFDSACFPYPTQQEMLQYKAAGLIGQDAVDNEYLQWEKRYPGTQGFCEQKRKNAVFAHQQQSVSQIDGRIENAPANDMSHYGDALPGGKN